MRVNKRVRKVNVAKNEIAGVLLDLHDKHELTDIEFLQILQEIQDRTLKYMLRFERHGNYDKGAGEA